MIVTLHELIHALKFSDYIDTNELMDNYKDKYNISLKYTLSNEAYIEIWANILNCYLISQTTNKNPLKFFMTMVDLERSYSIYLAQKLLYRMKVFTGKSIIALCLFMLSLTDILKRYKIG